MAEAMESISGLMHDLPCVLTSRPSQDYGSPTAGVHMRLLSVGDRLVTPWLKLLGKGAPDPPMVHIFVKRTGEALKAARAEVSIPVISARHLRWLSSKESALHDLT